MCSYSFLRYYIFLFFISATYSIYPQTSKIDSLKTILNKEEDEKERLIILESLNGLFAKNSLFKETLPYFSEMALLSKNNNNQELETKAYRYITEHYMITLDSTRAKYYVQKSLKINEELDNLSGYLLDINQLGRLYHHFQQYEKATHIYLLGIEKFEQDSSNEIIPILSNIYSNLAISYERLGEIEKSINILIKGIKISEKLNYTNQKAHGLYAIGYNYMDLEQYEKAESYFLESLSYSDKISLDTYIYMNHHALGINYSRWGEYTKALDNNNIALEHFRKTGNKLYEFDVLNNTAVVYSRMGEHNKVLKYASEALTIAEDMKHLVAINGAQITLSNAYIGINQFDKAESYLLKVAPDTINPKIVNSSIKSAVYGNLSEVYSGQGKFKKALKFHKRYKEINDSIQKQIRDSEFADIESKYQLEKKSNVILQNEKEIESNKLLIATKQRNFLISVSIGSFILLLLGLMYFKKRKKENQLQNTIEHVKQLSNKILYQEEEAAKRKNNLDSTTFSKHLTKEYNLTKATYEYWDRQAFGVTEKEMETLFDISKSSVQSRRKELYKRLSVKTSTEEYDRHSSVSLYLEEIVDFMNAKIQSLQSDSEE